jgi:hypothetical protein
MYAHTNTKATVIHCVRRSAGRARRDDDSHVEATTVTNKIEMTMSFATVRVYFRARTGSAQAPVNAGNLMATA